MFNKTRVHIFITMLLFGLIIFMIIVMLFDLYFRYYKVCILSSSASQLRDNYIKTLLRQCARWVLAATQDQHAIVAIMHANYGAGYWWAIKEIATDEDIQRLTGGVKLSEIEDRVISVQETATKMAMDACPELAGEDNDPLMAVLGGKG